MDYDESIRKHEEEIARLKRQKEAADKLWKDHVAPLNSDERKLLFSLLHNHFHGEDE